MPKDAKGCQEEIGTFFQCKKEKNSIGYLGFEFGLEMLIR
jgi:ABC-type phosphate transport system substrate-binding protein